MSCDISNLEYKVVKEISELYPPWFNKEAWWHCNEFLKSRLNTSDLQPLPIPDVFVRELIAYLNLKIQSLADPSHMFLKNNLSQVIESLRTFDPAKVYTSLRDSLIEERKYLHKIQTQSPLELFEASMENVQILHSNFETNTAQGLIFNNDFQQLIKELLSKMTECLRLGENSVSNFIRNFSVERRSGSSDNFASTQEVFSRLIDTLMQFIHISNTIEGNLNLANVVKDMKDFATTLMEKLTCAVFMVEENTRQVLKTTTKFNVNIGLLAAKLFGVQQMKVQIKLIQESAAASIFKDKKITNTYDSYCEIKNDCFDLPYDPAYGRFYVKCDKLKLDGFKRSGRKSNDNVTDGKFAFLFESVVAVDGIELKIFTISSPVVIIVHGSQETQAYATIFWDNNFASPDRAPFEVPDKVPWESFANALNRKFEVELNRGLTPENLHFLGEKILRKNFNSAIPPETQITFSIFSKEIFSSTPRFTFLEWFEATFRLIKEHLIQHWANGSVYGFISRARTDELLGNCNHGTFILRFSDTVPGSISISWHDRTDTQGKVCHLTPFTLKELETRSLALRLNDLGKLSFLYPATPKSHAFVVETQKPAVSNDPTHHYVGYDMKVVIDTPPVADSSTIPNPPQYQMTIPSYNSLSPSYQSPFPVNQYNPQTSHEGVFSQQPTSYPLINPLFCLTPEEFEILPTPICPSNSQTIDDYDMIPDFFGETSNNNSME